MPFWERFGRGKKDLGLSKKDQEMMKVPQSEPELIVFGTEGISETESEGYKEEESTGIYTLPLPAIDNSLETGQEIADRDPKTPKERIRQVGPFLTDTSPESHREAFNQAIDFLVPDGTPVLSSSDGRIVQIVIHNNQWGPDKSFANKLNYITIQHGNGEFSQYCHLAQNSLPKGIEIGKDVQQGDQIALSGKTGWTDRDHLHFIVFKEAENPYGFKSLKPRFRR